MKNLPEIDVDQYLRRIDVPERQPPTLRFLRTLHRQHLLHIPFENLDIHWGREILLDYKRMYGKMVDQGRGGFCYELNGLFFALLTHLGFNTYQVSARMPRDDGSLSPDFEHMCLLTQVESEVYLCDVGFGKGPNYPLKVLSDVPQVDLNEFFRITKAGEEGWWLEQSDDGSQFERKYLFSPRRRGLVEFVDRCIYQQQNAASHFRKQKMITKATPEGRITLTENQLTVTKKGRKTDYVVFNNDDFSIKLLEHFGIQQPKD